MRSLQDRLPRCVISGPGWGALGGTRRRALEEGMLWQTLEQVYFHAAMRYLTRLMVRRGMHAAMVFRGPLWRSSTMRASSFALQRLAWADAEGNPR